MAKKVEKTESCSCETCKCWAGCCAGKCLISLLAIAGVVAAILACIYSCKALKATQKIYDFNVLSAGWETNLNRMAKVYQSDAFVSYMSDQAAQAEAYFWLDSDEPTYNEEENTNTVTWNDDIKAVVENMLASTPIRGDEDARFTIVEYTELLCPYCQRHSQAGTINSVIEQFPGEVNSVSRHFIIHGDSALQLASAMECIAELNPSVYHTTFEKAFEAYPVDMETLISIAAELGVNQSALQSCVDEWRYTQAVNDMMNQAYSLFWVNWTPGNVIIDRETGNYKLVSGAYPVSEFVNAINSMKNA